MAGCKQYVSQKAQDDFDTRSTWSLYRTYAVERLAENIANDRAYLVTITFDPGLRQKSPVIEDVLHPLIEGCLSHCWNAVNEVNFGKRAFHKAGDYKDQFGRGVFTVERHSKDGSTYVGPHIHGTIFVSNARHGVIKNPRKRMKEKLERIGRKIWPAFDVHIAELFGANDRLEGLKYALKEHGCETRSLFREGRF
ncbi:hypothetical protein [Maricaulis salignorans]|uniref:Uncharacterized protein n=1 Tax=Maricaulis salignorans TaxID=144026 RepID=A0A1G9U973_9PROT|nr:hypothetical protein [Maricaulis salignorans]SDM56470.1 hypothetical protein SAMN04488568_11446 [Maricaulis salignorans]